MICPECGLEYRDGFYECSDCNVKLVDELPIQLEEEVRFVDFVTVLETSDATLISIARSLLESSGIKFFPKDDKLQDFFALGRVGTGFNPLIGPMFLKVERECLNEAKELLAEIIKENEGIKKEKLPKEKVSDTVVDEMFQEVWFLVSDGIQAYEQKRFKEAEKKYKKALAIFPNSKDILYNLALVYFEQQRYSLVWKLVDKIGRDNCCDLVAELQKM
jgi:tetratricopeptide (TPR) repeat protein